MKYIKKIILPILIVCLYACNNTPELKENEIYDIINEIVFEDTIIINKVCWEFAEMDLSPEILSHFSKDDLNFYKNYKGKFKNLKIKPNKIKYFHRGYKPSDFAKVDSICSEGSLKHISFPFISIDRKKILLEIYNNCNCMLGSSGAKYLYQKINGHWKLIKTFDGWIS